MKNLILSLHPTLTSLNALPITAKTHIVPAAQGHAFKVPAHSRFRIVDIHGLQIVDLCAWVDTPTLHEHIRMSYTRFRLRGISPDICESLYTNRDRPALTVVADTCKIHDMTFMSCNPELYASVGKKGHRNCEENIFEVMNKFGIESRLQLPDPFNVFQNTPGYSLKPVGTSRPGDFVEFEAEIDLVVGISCCPWTEDGMNGGKATEVAVIMGI